ncbi:hypothetical protein FJZ33_09800 [Candidatus Poribacteria bacterium]|nr:hypothetical protein [Candidatus Poribacteria bacterium]
MKATNRNKNCLRCGEKFYCPPRIGIGIWSKRKFCSQSCAAKIVHLGQKPWNKGIPMRKETRIKMSKILKGKHNSLNTEFKKGDKGIWLGKKRLNISGEHNYRWKGEKVGYCALHSWIRKEKGKPIKCEICKSNKNLDWANKDHKYKRNLIDWLQLCHKCHYSYDLNHKFRKPIKDRKNE